MARILIADALDAAASDLLRKAGHEVFEKTLSPDDLLKEMPSFDALLVRSATKVTKAVFGVAANLKVVGRAGVGVDNIDLAAAKANDVAVVNAPLAATNAVAELTVGQMLALCRSIPRADATTRQGEWAKKQLKGIELSGRTLGLLGVGRIGGRVAEICQALGMNVVVYDPYVPAERAAEMAVRKVDTPTEVAQLADFISVHVPLTDETRHLVSTDFLAACKKGAHILNVARGGVVDEAALLKAIESRHIAGAALDVFETEPLKESALFAHPNVHLSPHIGANTHEAQQKAAVMVAEQVLKVLDGQTPDHRVV